MIEQKTDSPQQELSIRFKYSEEHRISNANGVYGGVNPHGEVVCHFFVDYNALPASVELIPDKEQNVFKENVVKKSEGIERVVQTTIMMNPNVAKSVGEWLINHAKLLQDLPTNQKN